MRPWYRKRRKSVPLLIGVLVLLFLVALIDDWKRDFTSNEAEISFEESDPRLKPFILELPGRDAIRIVKRAAGRIRGWEYVGDARDGNSTQIVFVRTSRVFRLKDDILLRVEDLGNRCVLTGASRSRHGFGDLGQNPRNLRRIIDEIRIVLEDEKRTDRQP